MFIADPGLHLDRLLIEKKTGTLFVSQVDSGKKHEKEPQTFEQLEFTTRAMLVCDRFLHVII